MILLLNKVDQISPAEVMPLIAHWSALYNFAEIIPISARKKINLDLLLDKVVAHLPEGQRYFPKDQLTDQPERFLVAELIREKILLLTGEEVPYATAVVIEKFEEPRPQKGKSEGWRETAADEDRGGHLLRAYRAEGHPDRQAGKHAEGDRHAARKEIESLLGTRVFLELFVKVQEEWRSKPQFIEDLDWRRQLEQIAAKQAAEEKVPE